MINNENNYKNDKNFCGSLYNGVDEILEGDGCKVNTIEIKERFNEVDERIKSHDERLRSIEIEFAKNNETLNNVKQGQESLKKSMDKIEGQMLTNHNAMLSGLNNLLMNKQDNSTKVEVAKIDGKSKVYIQIILFFGGLATIGGSIYMAVK